jgi:serine/threonine protein kinase
MPPEQARGKRVDKRADIWGFGVVLYEMLTGKRLFEGETVSDTLIEVATKEPDWIPAAPGKNVQRLLRRCLEKDPERRLRDIGKARFLLEEVGPTFALPDARAMSLRRRLWPGVAALLFVTDLLPPHSYSESVTRYHTHFVYRLVDHRNLRWTVVRPAVAFHTERVPDLWRACALNLAF